MEENKMTAETPKLKNCPFCWGIAAKDYGSHNDDDFHIFCHSCQARSVGRNNINAAISAWNARAGEKS
jgi:hypothetical protein